MFRELLFIINDQLIRLSVIIPTHKRADILTLCLRHLERQTIADQIEVIVVSDGRDDKTAALFACSSWRISVRFFEIEKSQQGSARNEGLKHAGGDYALFIGDDIFLSPDACEKHLEAHGNSKNQKPNSPLCVLGFTTWDPAVGVTPVMRWLERSGWQFGYPRLSRYANGFLPKGIQHQYTYTSHISLPLSIAKKHLFRTDVHLYGWEDVEWGMRLRSAGVRLCYEPDAKALHHHRMNLEESLFRMQKLGRSAVDIARKIPQFDRNPKGLRLFLYRFAAMLPTMAGRHRRAFLRGMDEMGSV